MRIVLQRVLEASVSVDGETIGSIGAGYLLFAGIERGDAMETARYLASKIARMRLFDGPDGKVNDRSILAVRGEILVISQFTLCADVSRGNRPDYTRAEHPAIAAPLYEGLQEALRAEGITRVAAGRFGAHMAVSLINDGPVTLLLERR